MNSSFFMEDVYDKAGQTDKAIKMLTEIVEYNPENL